MTIRSATDGDIPGLIDLQARSIAVGYPTEIRNTLVNAPSICANDLRWRWSANHAFIVAEDKGGIRGFAMFAEQDNEVELYGLFVDPVVWRQGIGSRLVEAAVQAAASMGRTRMIAKVNPLASEFYEVNGFVRVGVAPMGGMAVPVMARPTP